jgi:hypothetical protein
MDTKDMTQFKIQGPWEDDDDAFLYWSNDLGWVDAYSATTFSTYELLSMNNPIGTTGIALLDDGKLVDLPIKVTLKK